MGLTCSKNVMRVLHTYAWQHAVDLYTSFVHVQPGFVRRTDVQGVRVCMWHLSAVADERFYLVVVGQEYSVLQNPYE